MREPVPEEVATPDVVPEEPSTPEEPVFDEMAFWAGDLERYTEKFLQDPGNLDRADSLLTHAIIASLSLQGRFIQEPEGRSTHPPERSEDEQWISASGPFGHRSFLADKFEFPERWEIMKAWQQTSEERGNLFSPGRIPEDLSGRILALANRVQGELQKR